MPSTQIVETNKEILDSVQAQISDLRPAVIQQAEIASLLADLRSLQALLKPLADASINKIMESTAPAKDGLIDRVGLLLDGGAAFSSLGGVLVRSYDLERALESKIPGWISGNQILDGDASKLRLLSEGILEKIKRLIAYRPDVGAVMADLDAIKHLRGGPADAVAFHDFHVLQIAFRSVWMHAFDEGLKSAAERLYEEMTKLNEDAGITTSPLDAITDIKSLNELLESAKRVVGDPTPSSRPFQLVQPLPVMPGGPVAVPPPDQLRFCPPDIIKAYPEAGLFWNELSEEQKHAVQEQSNVINSDVSLEDKEAARKVIAKILQTPIGNSGRLRQLILEIGQALSEPYAFDIFAPDSYNFGILATYRQKWEPGEYQAGNLVSTMPLAPGETRKFTKKKTVKSSRAVKEIEKSMSFRSVQSSETSRAELDIMDKTTTATNFKMTSHGSFNIGIGELSNTTEIGSNQSQESTKNKKDFHEATLKAAEEYRLERSLEVDTATSTEYEETSSGEISNPNNEITVTYLFFELQRRFRIYEFLYRVRPVILVAQDVPSPHEIDEAWLIQYQWILARVLLDESLRPALDYLISGFAGDEIATEIIRANWQKQRDLVEKLELQVSSEIQVRDQLREDLVRTTQFEQSMPEMPTAAKIFTFGVDPSEGARDVLEAKVNAGKTRLQYVEQALADAQDKLRGAVSSFEKATEKYSAAIQNQYSRHVALDQLRVHVKQNILYYMQAIWAHEPPDQRFFRLYNKKVICPDEQPNCTPKVVAGPANPRASMVVSKALSTAEVEFEDICEPAYGGGGVGGHEHELIEVADIDNPLGYKGNYMIFPLKDDCALTRFMIAGFIDEELGLRDPDGSSDFDAEKFDTEWTIAMANLESAKKQKNNTTAVNDAQSVVDALKDELIKYIAAQRHSTDEVIVPTGHLFIEALPGTHPLLEDFKLAHRFEDVLKVKAEVRHAELENLRLASRLAAGQDGQPTLFEDPDIEKKIVVGGNVAVTPGS